MTDAPESRLAFPRAMRLSGERAFAAVFEARCRKNAGPLAVSGRPNELRHNRLGLSVSRRLGGAVERNRIKRRLREAFRLSQHQQPAGYDIVIVVRPHKLLSVEAYQQHLLKAFGEIDALWQKRRPRK